MPHWAPYIRTHSLYVTRWCNGSQQSCIMAGVMWSRDPRPNTILASAFWTLCSGAVVDAGSRRTKNYNSRAVTRWARPPAPYWNPDQADGEPGEADEADGNRSVIPDWRVASCRVHHQAVHPYHVQRAAARALHCRYCCPCSEILTGPAPVRRRHSGLWVVASSTCRWPARETISVLRRYFWLDAVESSATEHSQDRVYVVH